MKPGQVVWPAVVFLSGLILLSLTWTDAIQVADSGELVAAACNLGVAHPPGYPLYTLLGHVMCLLPGSTEAGRVAWLSVGAGLLAMLLVYTIVVRAGGRPWAAAAGALTLASGDIFWRYSSLPEVFGLNAALCLGVLFVSLEATRSEGASRGRQVIWSMLCGLTAGLALSNHHSAVWVLPVAVPAVLLPLRPVWALGARVAAGLAGGLLGLSPYLHLLLADPKILPRWGDTSTWSGFLVHFLRQDYGTFSLSVGGKASQYEALGYFFQRLPGQLTWVLWAAALAGVVALMGRATRSPWADISGLRLGRAGAGWFALACLLAGPGFFTLFNLGSAGTEAMVVERFFILPVSLLCVCVGLGLNWLDRAVLAMPDFQRTAPLWRVAAFVVLGITALGNHSHADVSDNYAVEDYAYNLLSSVDEGALVLGIGDVDTFSVMHAQRVLGYRPDVQFINVKLLLYPWYVAQKKRERPGLKYTFTRGNVNSIQLIRQEMARGVPVYLASAYNKKVLRAFAGYPYGPLIRLLSPFASSPPPAWVLERNERLYERFLRRGPLPDPKVDPWSAQMHESYAAAWQSIAGAALASGDRKTALRALSHAREWAPWKPLLGE